VQRVLSPRAPSHNRRVDTEIGGRRFHWGSRVSVMGIVNATPDSFSGDGVPDPDAAVRQALRMIDEGADIIDVGGESTRPGHEPVTAEEELRRVLPVLRRLCPVATVPVSIDTWKQEVAEAGVAAGAAIVNDIWGLQRSPGLAALAAERGLGLVLMHNQRGTAYGDLMADVIASLRRSLAAALAAGVPRERVILDPGIGFGKTSEQGVEVLRRFAELASLDQPLLVGPSRKSYLGRIFGQPPGDRLPGTIASVTAAVLRGADIVRVHDVADVVRAVRVAEALR
jgi:dihydropteroate synthase